MSIRGIDRKSISDFFTLLVDNDHNIELNYLTKNTGERVIAFCSDSNSCWDCEHKERCKELFGYNTPKMSEKTAMIVKSNHPEYFI